jgi:hypothetical protein
MNMLFLKSYVLLLRIDLIMRFRSLQALQSLVRHQVGWNASRVPCADAICHAVDLACVFYIKSVLCLQRSAVTAILLRRHGWNAEMVIGAQTVPFKSHAWVELEGAVANDKPYMPEIYTVLERW